MLNFNEKLSIIESFPQLQRKDVSLGRVNFQFPDSVTEKKNIVYHLHPNGNGFVYAGELTGYPTDAKGMVNIREFSAEELRKIIHDSIQSLSPKTLEEEAIIGEAYEETWINQDDQTLVLIEEDDMWNVYAGLNLDGTFNSYGEAIQYLDEEGFHRLS
ncbi:hypothetical protein [Pseudobacillus wudalianchiensis]|uniref:Uncharacterized protein n=1 Tax=Pseudobacillus wudalianchiensis TaxID=1743143 RepID=A0A1B9AXR5_9BACI|nr:hypothetical protein [Bacillus wudalianchiensis]OCA88765.1 hypothetical protein A8F95_04785 [Bacillus wudalianchiensis]